MKVALAAILALAITAVHAQTAQVIALSPEDTAQIKALYEQQAEANKRVEDFRKKIQDKYASEDRDGSLTASGYLCAESKDGFVVAVPCAGEKATKKPEKKQTYRAIKNGWTNGFQLSTDYKFIVPTPEPVYRNQQYQNCCNGWNNNGAYWCNGALIGGTGSVSY